MTSDEHAFLAAIIAHPDDDTARLVYADWLTENGRPDRGAFVRAQIELARTPPTTEDDERRRRVLIERRDDLLKRYKAKWLAPFSPYEKAASFDRGFVHEIGVPASAFLQHAETWLALTPLTRVKITSYPDRWRGTDLLAAPHLARLTALDLASLRLTAADLKPLAAQPGLPRLRELVLSGNQIRSDGATLLAGMPQLSGLESLDLRDNGITGVGARTIARSPHLRQLKELQMTRNPIRDPAWAVLVDRFGDALTA